MYGIIRLFFLDRRRAHSHTSSHRAQRRGGSPARQFAHLRLHLDIERIVCVAHIRKIVDPPRDGTSKACNMPSSGGSWV